jgi:hypothetical protein
MDVLIYARFWCGVKKHFLVTCKVCKEHFKEPNYSHFFAKLEHIIILDPFVLLA